MLKVINCAVCGQPTTYKTKKSKYCSRSCKYQAIGKQQQRLWRAKNREKCRHTQNAWNAANRARIYAKKEAWLTANPDKKQAMIRRQHLRRYGMKEMDYCLLYYQQDGKCAACKRDYMMYGHDGLVVDHDHQSGKVRGLLCAGCNAAIGHAKERVLSLRGMIEYLETQEQRHGQ